MNIRDKVQVTQDGQQYIGMVVGLRPDGMVRVRRDGRRVAWVSAECVKPAPPKRQPAPANTPRQQPISAPEVDDTPGDGRVLYWVNRRVVLFSDERVGSTGKVWVWTTGRRPRPILVPMAELYDAPMPLVAIVVDWRAQRDRLLGYVERQSAAIDALPLFVALAA